MATAEKALSDAVHELRTSLGSVRFALTALLDEPDAEVEYRVDMLTRADVEVRRLALALTALPALAASRSEDTGVEGDLSAALAAAADAARRRGVGVDVDAPDSLSVRPTRGLVDALAALILITAEGGQDVDVVAELRGADVAVRMARRDGEGGSAGTSLVAHLIDGIGATAEDAARALAFVLEGPNA